MALERAGELADGPGEGKIEKQLEPAGAPLIAVVSVGGPQFRLAETYCVTVSRVHRSTRVRRGTGLTGVRHGTADGAAFEPGSQCGQRAAVNAGGGHRRLLLSLGSGRSCRGRRRLSERVHRPPQRAELPGRC
jgi:hypothetical protein